MNIFHNPLLSKRLLRALGAALCLSFVATSLLPPSSAEAAGRSRKKATASEAPLPAGKRVLALAPIERVRIEMPDNEIRDFGDDFLGRLRTEFTQADQFVVMDPESPALKRDLLRVSPDSPELNYEWESNPVPAATVRINVAALSFVTGGRGGRMFYGFDERLRNAFNDGSGNRKNEYPVNTAATGKQQPSWFDGTFNPIGSKPFDSRSGLDLGDGFGLDVLFAWFRIKYAKYRAELKLDVEIEAPLAGRYESRTVHVSGKGFFYDVAGGYVAWDGAIRIARRDAMLKAFNRAFKEASARIRNTVGPLPLTARVDAVSDDGKIFLATGRRAQIPVGTIYYSLESPSLQIQVTQSLNAGSLATLSQGDPAEIHPGMLFIDRLPERRLSRMALSATTQESTRQLDGIIVDLPAENLSPPAFGRSVREISRIRAFLLSVAETIFLPYRIWRYHHYDRSYKARADDSADSVGTQVSTNTALAWAQSARREPWARQIGLRNEPIAKRRAVVALIDSGIDYNHMVLHDSLWLNPNPSTGLPGGLDRYGWDFISGDSRPFDDGYHGTRAASALIAVAPSARIMPLKIFNPWGITNSASILGAFEYAVEHDADLILCPWSTRFHSEAIEQGIALAARNGIPVIAAAGDLGRDLRIAPAYPAALAPKFPNLLVVTAVDAADRPLRLSNGHPEYVHVAAPGANIRVADPRNLESRASSTGIAAAIVAGVIAKTLSTMTIEESVHTDWRREIQNASEQIPSLRNHVENGFRLKDF